jgi:diketogulonate reductase-like aldo/keto reductase
MLPLTILHIAGVCVDPSCFVPLRGIGGKTVALPLVGLGTWRMGNASVTQAAVELAISVGYRHFDCALGYGNQEGVGAALKGSGLNRSDYLITSKIPGGLNASATEAALDESLAQLGVDYVDLMLIHYPASWSGEGGPEMRKEEWLAMERWARKGGRARALGVSHYCSRHLRDVLSVATEPVALNQVQYHIGMGAQSGANASLRHDPEFMKEHGVVYMAYSSLCGPCPVRQPALTPRPARRLSDLPASANARCSLFTPPDAFAPLPLRPRPDREIVARRRGPLLTHPRAPVSYRDAPAQAPDNTELINGPLVSSIGKAHHKTGPQVALKWAVQQRIPVIPKSTKALHLEENLALFGWSLAEEEMARLSKASSPPETGTPPQPPDDAQDCLVP